MDAEATTLLVDALNTVDGVTAEIMESGRQLDFDDPEADDIPPFSTQTFTVRIEFDNRTQRHDDQVDSILAKHDIVVDGDADGKGPRRDLGDELHVVTKEIEEH